MSVARRVNVGGMRANVGHAQETGLACRVCKKTLSWNNFFVFYCSKICRNKWMAAQSRMNYRVIRDSVRHMDAILKSA